LTTVFCNSASKCGIGKSCVIGHDGWDNDRANELPNEAYPHGGPYHGLNPGIFHQWSKDRGALKKEEQAMVIVDVDPIYSMEGKPRPQLLPKPIELVAHLPIFEFKDEGKYFNINKLNEAWNYWPNVEKQEDVEAVTKFLNLLPSIDKRNQDWLKERAKHYVRFVSNNPRLHIPPVALDWLFVHPKSSEQIYVPPYVPENLIGENQ